MSPNGPAALTQPEAGRAWPVWSDVVTRALGVPDLPELATAGVLGERAELRANFRDEYYGLVPAVAEGGDGPPLLTSGLIDPGRSHWGARTARFARHRFTEPRVELGRLSPPMRAWALAKLVPKVLVASQTRVLEALADPDGELLPGVPLTAITPLPLGAPDVERAVWEIAAVLTSPVASAWAWHHCAGTGLSSTALRTGPRVLAGLPWPAGELAAAVGALRDGHVVECGRRVDAAFGADGKDADELHAWWEAQLPVQPAEASALAR